MFLLRLSVPVRGRANALFIDKIFNPYEDQWAFLSSIQRMNFDNIKAIFDYVLHHRDIIDVKTVITEEDEILPYPQCSVIVH